MRAEIAKMNAAVAAYTLRLAGGHAELAAEEGQCTLFMLTGGSCTLACGDSTAALSPGCTVLLGAGLGGSLKQTSRTMPEIICCVFPLPLTAEVRGTPQKELFRQLAADTPAILHGSAQWNGRLRTLLELVHTSQDEPEFPGLGYLFLVLHYVDQQYTAESRAAARPSNETVEQICAYLSENYAQKLSLGEVATRFYLSPYYLSRLFRRVTGISIVDYINARRIEAAQRLLETTDLSITAVAEQTGFSTAAHFRRVFREQMRVGPLQYRKGHKME